MLITDPADIIKKEFSKSYRRQFFVSLAICSSLFLIGATLGWTSPTLQKLSSPDSYIQITSEEGSWLALYPEFGHFIAPIFVGILSDIIGRKIIFIVGSFITLTGWLMKIFAETLLVLNLARVLLGISYGFVMTVSHIYIAEVVSKNVRGTFSSLLYVALNLGILFEFAVGSFFSIRTAATITSIISAINFIAILFIRESPYFYIGKKNEFAARSALIWFRGSFNEESSREFESMRRSMNQTITFSRSTMKSLIICLLLCFLSDCTGRAAMLTYAMQNFTSTEYISVTGFTILLGSLNALLPLIPTLFSDKIGRKIIILIAGTMGAIIQFFSGFLYFCHDNMNIEIPGYGLLLFLSITGFLCCCSVFTTNVLILRGELLSENARGVSSGIISMAYALSIMVTIKSFQLMRDYVGLYGSFWLLTAWSITFVLFTKVSLPETKGKSFDEIQKEMGRT